MISNGNWCLKLIATVGLLFATVSVRAQSRETRQQQWPTAGQNLDNSRNQPAERSITPANVNTLTTKWVFTTGGDVSATPTVFDGVVYFPDWGGNLYAREKEALSRNSTGFNNAALIH